MLRADLGADTTPRTHDRIDVHPVLLDKKGRAGQILNTISMTFTFVTDKKRFSPGFFQTFRIQRTHFLGNNHRNPFIASGLL